MAKKAKVEGWKRPAKFRSQRYSRCGRCGRTRGTLRKFKLCRICFREMAHRGQVPGLTKASW
jgi:small subunit ribosomal protein S14